MSRSFGEDSASQHMERPESVPRTSPKPDIARRIERRQQEAAQQRRRKIWILISLTLFIAVATVSSLYFFVGRKTAPPIPPKRETSIEIKGQEVGLNGYLQSSVDIDIPNEGAFSIFLFDFDAHRFLKGKELVSDPGTLEQVFRDERERFNSAWIIIFAGASFEDTPDLNRDLCRRRVRAVAKLISQKVGILGQGYWSIVAGEFKEQSISQGDEENTEEKLAKEIGEKGLAPQRRLVIVAVKPSQAESKETYPSLNEIVRVLREHQLLPTSYDHGQSDPAPLAAEDFR